MVASPRLSRGMRSPTAGLPSRDARDARERAQVHHRIVLSSWGACGRTVDSVTNLERDSQNNLGFDMRAAVAKEDGNGFVNSPGNPTIQFIG